MNIGIVYAAGLGALALTVLSSCGIAIKTRGTNVPLEITAELTVDDRQIVQTWSVPGVPARESSNRPGAWSTYPALGSALVRLPTGEGLWIDLAFESPHLPDVPGATDRYHSSLFYFVDSVSNPQVLTDYFNTATPGKWCPRNFRIKNCEIALTIKRLPDGAPVVGPDVGGGDGIGWGYPDRLRTSKLTGVRPAFFLSLTGTMHKTLGAEEDALLGPQIRSLDRPTVLRLDHKSVVRLMELTSKPESGRVHLRYLGGDRWAAPDTLPDQVHASAIRDVGYRIQLVPADAQCCSAPTEQLKPTALPSFGGKVEWRGQSLAYDITLSNRSMGLYWDVLYDPRDETAVILTIPEVKPAWQLPADPAGG